VLEIGSGGYNAALIAEIVGPTGAVTSIDIDSDVVTNARAALARAGYPQVHVAQADAGYGYPDAGPYDAIIVTVEATSRRRGGANSPQAAASSYRYGCTAAV
jgi:protein-L-isoaspartate(D-aspartate) O-methyltransferase